ncbi:MAG: MBL fold metallo-hydrolase [Planctomycetaceae bacterium]|nr:MBL fold metallo-hydrolase [Planctomycetaceae bacterium]
MSAADATITIVIRGARGSHPMPGPATVRYGGNTTCQEIHVGGRLIVLDAGTGIISLGNELAKKPPQTMAVFFSHNHHDHIDGILYFKPAYQKTTTMYIYGPADEPGTIMDALETISSPAAHPVQFARMGMKFDSTILKNGDVVVWRAGADAPSRLRDGDSAGPEDVVLRVLKNNLHPIEGVLNFRLEYGGKSYVYATDVEGNEERGDPELAAFARGTDLLAHDGQYTSAEYADGKRGWGHSTIRMAIKTAEAAGVEKLAIIHHEPEHSDDQLDAMEAEGKKAWPGLFFAREGQVITI